MPPNLSGMPPIHPELATNTGNPNYWHTLVSELTKLIPPAPTEIPPKDDKLADKVAWENPKVYDGKHDLVELEEWIRGMEKIFTVVEVSEDKKMNIGTFYLIGEAEFGTTLLRIGS